MIVESNFFNRNYAKEEVIDLTVGYVLSITEMKKLTYWADVWPPSPSHLESQGWAVSITFFMAHGGHFRWFSCLKVSSLMVVEFKKLHTYTWGAWLNVKSVITLYKKWQHFFVILRILLTKHTSRHKCLVEAFWYQAPQPKASYSLAW